MRKSITTLAAAALVLGAGLIGARAEGTAEWGYEGEHGPGHWAELSQTFGLCATGTAQSPIDIPSSAQAQPAKIAFDYRPSALTLLNNGHAIQANYDPGSTIALDGKTYALLQVHFHARSEHTRAGEAYPLEMHLVHRADDGALAVVGAWVKEGQENAAFAPLWKNLPASESAPKTMSGVTIDADDLLPADRAAYAYKGSLTTPPCSEGVHWVMLATPVEMSAGQIAAYHAIYDDTFRPVQALNGRKL